MQMLDKAYAKYGMSYPCTFDSTARVKEGEVQNWFRLERMEDDLRLEELDQLMIERMEGMSTEELEDRCRDVLKLYGRLNIWAGASVRTLTDCRLRPSPASFLPQNYTISRAGDGYGMFRVDHTSTLHVPEMTEQEIFDGLQKEVGQGGLEQCVVMRFPTAVLLAIGTGQVVDSFLKQGERCKGSLLRKAYYYMGPVRSRPDGYMHFVKVLAKGFVDGFQHPEMVEPIEKSRFMEFLD
jgi:hypothetical protein